MEVEGKVKMYFDKKINTELKDIRINEAVMNEITRPRTFSYYKTVLTPVLLLLIFMTSTGIVYGKDMLQYIKNLDLFNNKGEVEWRIATDEEEYGSYHEIAQKTFDSLDLEEGKAVAIYVANNNPKNIIVAMQKPIIYEDLTKVKSLSFGAETINLNSEILKRYQFLRSNITYELKSESKQIFMDNSTKVAGESVFVKEIGVTDRIQSISYDYHNENEQLSFTLIAVKWNGNQVFKQPREEEGLLDYDSIMIGESEVLYEHLNEAKQISWIQEGYYYTIRSDQTTMTKDEIVLIAKEIKGND